jgi:hypothetical protein
MVMNELCKQRQKSTSTTWTSDELVPGRDLLRLRLPSRAVCELAPPSISSSLHRSALAPGVEIHPSQPRQLHLEADIKHSSAMAEQNFSAALATWKGMSARPATARGTPTLMLMLMLTGIHRDQLV